MISVFLYDRKHCGYLHFLLFQQWFQKATFSGLSGKEVTSTWLTKKEINSIFMWMGRKRIENGEKNIYQHFSFFENLQEEEKYKNSLI